MSFENFETAISLIRSAESDFEGKKESSLVDLAERRLGLKFPPTYRCFLETFGCGDVEGVEFYGIISNNFENSGIPDAVWLTLEERKSGLPPNLVLIYVNGDGVYFGIDVSYTDSSGENPVVEYHPNGSIIRICDSFGSFLLAQLQTVI